MRNVTTINNDRCNNILMLRRAASVQFAATRSPTHYNAQYRAAWRSNRIFS
jgi:hypothetical protein